MSDRDLTVADGSAIGPDERIYMLNKVAVLAAYLLRHGVETRALLEGSAIAPAALADAGARISRRQLFAVYRNFIRLAPHEHAALDAGATFNLTNLGVCGYALQSSSSFREACEFVITYRQLGAPTIERRLVLCNGNAAWELAALPDMPADPPMRRFTYDFQSASDLALHRSILGADFRFLSVDLPFPAPRCADYYRGMFACPVNFGASAGWLRFGTEWLDRPPVGRDPITHSIVLQICDDMMAQLGGEPGVVGEIQRQLVSRPGSFPDLETMAARLNVSSRTIRRRLQSAGKTYRQVLDATRLHLATRYLSDSDMTHEHIAARLDFSSAENFRRAFQRWTGRSPGRFRTTQRTTQDGPRHGPK
jgi:AraC-like DNA-binding protein